MLFLLYHTNESLQTPVEYSSPDISPLRGSGPSPALIRVLANSSPIHAANPQTTQQSIMSMEDDEISDQEIVRSVNIRIYI